MNAIQNTTTRAPINAGILLEDNFQKKSMIMEDVVDSNVSCLPSCSL